ncbi:MAG: DUF1284 domain-containing protein [Euryarchaeota archaeon]|jgi:hypothetical protein|uniref:DUF1284 domain-containing protein n=1 Tax=Methanobacterium sp. MZD130B TaxID=3394378 RepID=UPI001771EFD9|nr:DUF1284 domain-containing protein [Euryarchaeota archaeon]HHT19402.1 DUF1284 domain-containing protein [Methanobacterium sp.]
MVKNVENGVGSKPLRIRAHHLLCIQGFQGFGYSKEFTDNMAKITEQILKNPFSFIKIVNGADLICECCPHNNKGICNAESSSPNSVMFLDSLVLQNLKIEEGSIVSASQISLITKNLDGQTVNEICGNCSWRSKCLFFQEKRF